ncbi:MAG: hypothetical protein E7439_01720 [Ruminococcaceae bacterium]|nr:hypothetical protein [Oscillospiraceae bacterium]
MSDRFGNYKDFDRLMSAIIIATTVDFILFLIFAGIGILWLKVITAIVAIGVPVLCLIRLVLSREWLRERSLWLTTGFAAIMVCTIVSLICNFPGPA